MSGLRVESRGGKKVDDGSYKVLRAGSAVGPSAARGDRCGACGRPAFRGLSKHSPRLDGRLRLGPRDAAAGRAAGRCAGLVPERARVELRWGRFGYDRFRGAAFSLRRSGQRRALLDPGLRTVPAAGSLLLSWPSGGFAPRTRGLLVVVSSISDGGVGEDFCIPGERERGERGLTRR